MKKSIGIILMVLLFLSMATGLGFAIGNLVTIKSAEDGKSAYQLAVENGFNGDVHEWLASLDGADGREVEIRYNTEKQCIEWKYEGDEDSKYEELITVEDLKGDEVQFNFDDPTQIKWKLEGDSEWKTFLQMETIKGENGKSAFDLYKDLNPNYTGTLEEWLASLKGEQGVQGETGKSAYQLAVENGFNGDVQEWLASLDGADGRGVEIRYNTEKQCIEWKYEGDEDSKYEELITVEDLKGDEVQFNFDDPTQIKWKLEGDSEWKTFLQMETIKGESAFELYQGLNPDYTGTLEDWLASLKGEQGEQGVGISKIEYTSSNGSVDTYTIYFTNGTETTFTVTNGAQGIQGIEGKPGEDGHTPVITIQNGYWYVDGVYTDVVAEGIKGDTGNGISKIEKTETDGLVDTYTIYFTNGDTTTFTVTNGAGVEYEDGKLIINGEEVVLAGSKVEYTVKFEINGELYAEQTTENGKVIEPTAPTKQGYKFVGWFYQGVQWEFVGYSVTENMTLEAVFESEAVQLSAVVIVDGNKVDYSFVADSNDILENLDSIIIVIEYDPSKVAFENYTLLVASQHINVAVAQEEGTLYVQIGDFAGSLSDVNNRLISLEFEIKDETEATLVVKDIQAAGVGGYLGSYDVSYETEIIVK